MDGFRARNWADYVNSVVVEARKHEHVRILIHNHDIRIINPATGELLRELTLDPTRDYQPQKPQNALPKEGEI